VAETVPAAPESKRRNLVLRLVSAFGLLPFIIWLIWLGGWPFAGLLAAVSGLATHEIYAMSLGGPGSTARPAPLSAIAWLGVALAMGLQLVAPLGWTWPAVPSALVGFLIAASAAAVLTKGDLATAGGDVPRLLFGWVYGAVLIASLGLVRQFPHGFWWVILACTVSWGNDTGGYFVGHALGKHKLHPRVSPGKTWEGFFGGMAAAVVFTLIMRAIANQVGDGMPELTLLDCVLVAVPASLLGPLGDLSESLLKRTYGVKDSGRFMPGHGGMLDRIDALIFNAPFVYFYAIVVKGLAWH
jgi:phosphatidate cytidylyltransferase